jgi:signal peptidase I
LLRGGGRHSLARPAGGRPGAAQLGLELAFTALVVVVAAFALKTFVVQTFYIPSKSMQDTLQIDDRITVSKLAPGLFDVHRGDIVVFHDPGGWSDGQAALPAARGFGAWVLGVVQALGFAPESANDFLVKRVVGQPGDVVACAGPGQPVTVNGVALDEVYLKPGVEPSAVAFSVRVPADAFWVMGDNRANSMDSRYHQDQALGGAIPAGNVVGVAKARLWPLSRAAVLRNPGAVFEGVPAGG